MKSVDSIDRRSFFGRTASIGLGAAAFILPIFKWNPSLAALAFK